jgi:hypothetical protein
MTRKLEVNMEFPEEGTGEGVTVTRLGKDRYRIESPILMSENVTVGDIIEAIEVKNGELEYRRVLEESRWNVFEFAIEESLIETDGLKRILEQVNSVGGHWDRLFGGVLVICLPPDAAYDPSEAISGVERGLT